jgi:hypothetical protein
MVGFAFTASPVLVILNFAIVDSSLNSELNQRTNSVDNHGHDQLVAHISIPVVGVIVVVTVENLLQGVESTSFLHVSKLDNPSRVKECCHEHIVTDLAKFT